jgi:DNA-binding protein YbaB
MFDNLKDIYNLKKQASEMERELASERVEAISSNNLVRIIINGKHDLLTVEILDQETYDKNELAQSFKEAFSKAQAKLQNILVQKFKGMI